MQQRRASCPCGRLSARTGRRSGGRVAYPVAARSTRVTPFVFFPTPGTLSFRHGLSTNAAARYGRRITQTRTLLQARPGAPSLFSGRTSAPGTPFSSDPNVRARHEPGARRCSCHRATGPALLRRPRRTAHGAGVIRIDIECAILETRQVAWRVSGLESAGNPFCAQRMVVVPDAITTNRRMSYSTTWISSAHT